MGRVQRLPEAVANQIAAGEVVERPASVVKELVENALDAGASRVAVEVEGGGVERLVVADDGAGMSAEDAALALERHATSKIRSADDLLSVRSLGFRGEALPSIASVSRFVLETREQGAELGTRLEVLGGAPPLVRAASAAPGTRVEVRDLFYNVPARRKFLKTTATEQSHISEALTRLALARPAVHFSLTTAGRVVLDAAPESKADPRGRLARLLGGEVARRLFPLAPPAERAPGSARVEGWAAAPDLSERTARGIQLFVNGRFVRDRGVQHAAQEAYRTLLERGRYPVVLLFLEIDPARIDVNVHPQKTEVRFADGGEVYRAVLVALRRTLEQEPWAPRAEAPAPARTYRLDGGAEHAQRMQAALHNLGRPGAEWRRAAERDSDAWRFTPASPGVLFDRPAPASDVARQPVEPAAVGGEARPPVELALPQAGALAGEQLSVPTGGRFGGLEPVGQVMATYLVCQGPGRLVLIDQHAAHERIAFDRLRRQARERRVEAQPLLVPQPIELEPARAAVAEESRARLAALGLELEPFGGSTWLVKSRPAALGAVELERMVRDLLDELKEVGTTTPLDEAVDALCSCAACHTVVRKGDRLSAQEIKALLLAMDQVDFGAYCPHGRPVFVEWSERELEKLFHRT